MGHRLRHSTTRVDLYRSRLGAAAHRTALGGATSPRRRHLESVEEAIDQSQRLVVTTLGAEPLLEDQGAADRGDDDGDGGRRKFVYVDAVFSHDEVQRGDLLLAPSLGPGRDLRFDLLAMVRKRS